MKMDIGCRFAFALLLSVAPRAAAGTNPDGAPEVIRLKVGTEVVIEVLEFDEAKGVRARRVDDGALLDLTFDQMVAEDAQRIRAGKGYLPDEPEPVLVDAMRVKLMGGEEFTGIIVEQGNETLTLRRGTQTWPLKRAGVRSITPVQVDALEVYDGEELYAQELAKRNPRLALDHYNLALFCESLQLWVRAKEHLAQVTTIEPGFKATIIDGKIKRATLRLESGEDSLLLGKAQRLAQRDNYDAALKAVDDFLEKKPGSALRAEFEKQRRLIAVSREKWLKQEVIVHFFKYAERVARTVAGEKEIGVKQARQRMELEGTTLIIEATSKWLKVPSGEVQAQWEDPKRLTASPHYASYGAGTFTIGSVEQIQKGLVAQAETAKKADPAAGNAGAEQGDYLEKIKKILEQKKKEADEAAKNKGKPKAPQKRGPEIADVPPTDDEWWATASSDERVQYLMAWWADHDPHVQIMKVGATACPQCAGEGLIRFFDRNGDNKFVPCSRCKSLGIDRTLRFH
ncbi:MAG: hypothetical protein EXS13_10555 [Planctomycetes bacterium]|nr:hypothetical protein [Planctomycetota bacterium]